MKFTTRQLMFTVAIACAFLGTYRWGYIAGHKPTVIQLMNSTMDLSNPESDVIVDGNFVTIKNMEIVPRNQRTFGPRVVLEDSEWVE